MFASWSVKISVVSSKYAYFSWSFLRVWRSLLVVLRCELSSLRKTCIPLDQSIFLTLKMGVPEKECDGQPQKAKCKKFLCPKKHKDMKVPFKFIFLNPSWPRIFACKSETDHIFLFSFLVLRNSLRTEKKYVFQRGDINKMSLGKLLTLQGKGVIPQFFFSEALCDTLLL